MDMRGEVYVALRNALEDSLRARIKDGATPWAEHLAREAVDPMVSVVGKYLAAPDAPPPVSESLDREVSRRVSADTARMVEMASERWESEKLSKPWGPLTEFAAVTFSYVREAWLTALHALEQHGDPNTVGFWHLLCGANYAVLNQPPLVTPYRGGVWLHFWAGLAEAPVVLNATSTKDNQPLAHLLATLEEMLIPLSIVAQLQWDLVEHVGAFWGRNRAGLAWTHYAQQYRLQAAQRLRKTELGDTPTLPAMEGMLVESPEAELLMAGRAMLHIVEGAPFWVRAIHTRKMVQKDEVRGFRIAVHHPMVSQSELRRILGAQLQSMGRGKQQALTPDDEAFLEAVTQAGFPEEGRAPSGFWTGFAETWNEGRDKPCTPNALRVRHHRLQQKLKLSQ